MIAFFKRIKAQREPKKTCLLLSFLLLLSFCQSRSNLEHNRFKGTIWVGGEDGGCWVKIDKVSTKSIVATIYTEEGDLWYKGRLIPLGKCSQSIDEISRSLDFFDGEKLCLKGAKCCYAISKNVK